MNQEFARRVQAIVDNIRQVVVASPNVVRMSLLGLLCQGHVLLDDFPGVGKTLLAKALAQSLQADFKRIQFTPDLLPTDITGSSIYNPTNNDFKFIPGPIFANIILADEINRTPPKTQAALLQAMQEYRVSIGGETYQLEMPFFVLATQNPIEQEGTYPLPEAQLDRFMLNIYIDYPEPDEEKQIVLSTTSAYEPELERALNSEDIIRLQKIVRKVPVAEHIVDYVVSIVTSSRPSSSFAPEFIKDWVSWGAGPRASQYLTLGAKARAIMHGRYHVSIEDIIAVAKPVLRHRILTNFRAEADGITSLDIIDQLLDTVKPNE